MWGLNLFFFLKLVPAHIVLVVLRVIVVLAGVQGFVLLFDAFDLEVATSLLEVKVALSGLGTTGQAAHPIVNVSNTSTGKFFDFFCLLSIVELVDIIEAEFYTQLKKQVAEVRA